MKNYFEYVIKKHETLNDSLPIIIYANRFENRTSFEIKTVHQHEFLTPETVK